MRDSRILDQAAPSDPDDQPVYLRAWVVEAAGDRVTVDAQLLSGGKVTATARGVFVAVGPDHPAYERW